MGIRRSLRLTVLLLAWLGTAAASADNFIDKRVHEDKGGIYRAQDAVPIALGVAVASCALLQGSEDRLGRECWVAGEAGVFSYLGAKGLQYVTRRESPRQTDDPGKWSGHGGGSFPSGHVALTTALVTPFLLEYTDEHPWVAALALLPVYEMVARVKARAHWQTDVLGGAALGFLVGALEYRNDSPFVLTVLPSGVALGFHKSL